jgi:nucleotide-binding universal stress UspA family protein
VAEVSAYLGDEQADGVWAQATAYLDRVIRELAATGVQATAEVRADEPATAILALAEYAGVDLIVMTTHAHGSGLHSVHDSLADKVLHAAHVPVLLVRTSDHPTPPKPILRILAPLDGSAEAERALAPAADLAAAFDAELLLFNAWHIAGMAMENFPVRALDSWELTAQASAEEYLSHTAGRLQAQGVRVRAETEFGGVEESIVDRVMHEGISLIVMSTHGRSGVSRLVRGSVADRVVRASPVPVMLVHAG